MPQLEFTSPPETLAEELDEVASDSAALASDIGKANSLPKDFPAEQLVELLKQLQTLPAGTAEGCRQPLEYARSRLPAIRRKYIVTEKQSSTHKVEAENMPPLTRGMSIDRKLTSLIGSVATALDEYRRLASEHPLDETDTSASIELDVGSRDVASAEAVSLKAEQALALGEQVVTENTKPDSKRADDLKRQMRDAGLRFKLSRIELRMPAFVPAWYRSMVESIRDYPGLMEKTASLMKKGADVTDACWRVFNAFADGQLKSVTDTVRSASQELTTLARKWKSENETGGDVPASPDTPPPGFDMDEVHAMILRGQPPPENWVPWITKLDFEFTEIGDITPLKGLSALQTLNFSLTQISDITPLKGLSALQRLDIRGTQISDITPLKGLSALQTLNIGFTNISDIAPLKGLSALQTLDISHTPINDLATISGFIALQGLGLSFTKITDLALLRNLPDLKDIYVEHGRVGALARSLGKKGVVKLPRWDGRSREARKTRDAPKHP